MQQNRGYSLMEIMISVAIVSILSAIAIPSYQTYVLRSSQNQAKSEVAALYTAMKSYFADNAQYTTRFDVIGYNPEGPQKYRIGFMVDTAPPVGATPQGNGTCRITLMYSPANTLPTCTYTIHWSSENSATNIAVSEFGVGSVNNAATPPSFSARAVAKFGNLRDSWDMNQSNVLTNTQN